VDEAFWRGSHIKRFVFWSSNDGEIIVSVSPDGLVTGKMFYELEYGAEVTRTERVRRWFGFGQRRPPPGIGFSGNPPPP